MTLNNTEYFDILEDITKLMSIAFRQGASFVCMGEASEDYKRAYEECKAAYGAMAKKLEEINANTTYRGIATDYIGGVSTNV